MDEQQEAAARLLEATSGLIAVYREQGLTDLQVMSRMIERYVEDDFTKHALLNLASALEMGL